MKTTPEVKVMALCVIVLALAIIIATCTGCESFDLPGEQHGTAQLHPPGLPCGFPGGLLVSSAPKLPVIVPAK